MPGLLPSLGALLGNARGADGPLGALPALPAAPPGWGAAERVLGAGMPPGLGGGLPPGLGGVRPGQGGGLLPGHGGSVPPAHGGGAAPGPGGAVAPGHGGGPSGFVPGSPAIAPPTATRPGVPAGSAPHGTGPAVPSSPGTPAPVALPSGGRSATPATPWAAEMRAGATVTAPTGPAGAGLSAVASLGRASSTHGPSTSLPATPGTAPAGPLPGAPTPPMAPGGAHGLERALGAVTRTLAPAVAQAPAAAAPASPWPPLRAFAESRTPATGGATTPSPASPSPTGPSGSAPTAGSRNAALPTSTSPSPSATSTALPHAASPATSAAPSTSAPLAGGSAVRSAGSLPTGAPPAAVPAPAPGSPVDRALASAAATWAAGPAGIAGPLRTPVPGEAHPRPGAAPSPDPAAQAVLRSPDGRGAAAAARAEVSSRVLPQLVSALQAERSPSVRRAGPGDAAVATSGLPLADLAPPRRPAPPVARHAREDAPPAQRHDEPALRETVPDPAEDDDVAERRDDPAPALTPEPDDAASLRRRLVEAGQHGALRELSLGRRVLVLLPRAGHGRAGVLWRDAGGRDQVQWFALRWRNRPAAARSDWLAWRVRREQRPDGRPRWVDSPPCPGAPRLCCAGDPPETAHREFVELGEPRRLVRAMGTQWSVLAVLAPPQEPAA